MASDQRHILCSSGVSVAFKWNGGRTADRKFDAAHTSGTYLCQQLFSCQRSLEALKSRVGPSLTSALVSVTETGLIASLKNACSVMSLVVVPCGRFRVSV